MGPRPIKRSFKGKSVSPKKKSKNVEEGKRMTGTSDSELGSCSESVEDEVNLTSLPNEILLHIFNYLSSVDLSSLSQLSNKRLTELTYTFKEAKFSSCQTNNVQLVKSFFNKIRVQRIQKLNFNYYCYMSPYELVSLISRCKNLSVLSVVECGLTFKNIICILKNCTKLEKLAWSINYDSGDVDNDLKCICMKQVYLFSSERVIPREIVFFIANTFPHLENVWICFFCDNIMSAFPFIGLMAKSFYIYSPEVQRHFTSISNASLSLAMMMMITKNLEFQFRQLHVQHPSNLICSRTYNFPPFLHIRSMSEDISLLSSGPFNAYSTLAIILTSNIVDVSESLQKCVEEVAGKKLKHFSLQHENCDSTQCIYPYEITDEESLAACELLTKIFLSSKNITVLNLSVHFCAGSPVKAITQLPSLKTLNIPSCAFGKSCTLVNSEVFNLSDIVSNCPKVEDFTLYCCVYASPPITEEDVTCMKSWSLLKHFTIYYEVLRSCNFLQKVADSCVDLLSFSLLAVSEKRICYYGNNLIYLLKKAKRLRFIRINDEYFYPMEKRFWLAIGEAANLEGICITTHLRTYIEARIILKEIKKLKYLKLFHFSSPSASETLYTETKKSMHAHGVKNVRIQQNCHRLGYPRALNQHHMPSLSCQSLHLKDMDIF